MAEKLRARLSRLLRQRMNANPALDTQIKVHKAAGLAQSTIQRLLAQEQAATVDVLDDLGRAFGFKQPHHFLLEDAEAAMLKIWAELPEHIRTDVLGYMRVAASGPAAAPDRLSGWGWAGTSMPHHAVHEPAPPSATAPSVPGYRAYSWSGAVPKPKPET